MAPTISRNDRQRKRCLSEAATIFNVCYTATGLGSRAKMAACPNSVCLINIASSILSEQRFWMTTDYRSPVCTLFITLSASEFSEPWYCSQPSAGRILHTLAVATWTTLIREANLTVGFTRIRRNFALNVFLVHSSFVSRNSTLSQELCVQKRCSEYTACITWREEWCHASDYPTSKLTLSTANPYLDMILYVSWRKFSVAAWLEQMFGDVKSLGRRMICALQSTYHGQSFFMTPRTLLRFPLVLQAYGSLQY